MLISLQSWKTVGHGWKIPANCLHRQTGRRNWWKSQICAVGKEAYAAGLPCSFVHVSSSSKTTNTTHYVSSTTKILYTTSTQEQAGDKVCYLAQFDSVQHYHFPTPSTNNWCVETGPSIATHDQNLVVSSVRTSQHNRDFLTMNLPVVSHSALRSTAQTDNTHATVVSRTFIHNTCHYEGDRRRRRQTHSGVERIGSSLAADDTQEWNMELEPCPLMRPDDNGDHEGCSSLRNPRSSQWTTPSLLFLNFSSHLIYPLTARVVGAPQMISQPVSSIFPCSPLSSGTWRTPGLSIPWCHPTSSSVCLVFFSLSLCLARWFWPDLMNGRHDHTTAVCVCLQWSGGLRVVRLPAGSWHGLPRW